MGCFNMMCSISHTPISFGDRVVAFLLLPLYDGSPSQLLAPGGCPGAGDAQMAYSIVGFPMRGNYSDYGTITYDDGQESVELVENYFGADINELADVNRKDLPDDLFKQLNITMMHERIFDSLKREVEGPYKKTIDDFFTASSELGAGSPLLKYLDPLTPSRAQFKFLDKMNVDVFRFKQQIIDTFWFNFRLTSMQRILLPSFYGGQNREWEMFLDVNSIASDILKKKIKG
jgi:hypothetical protein